MEVIIKTVRWQVGKLRLIPLLFILIFSYGTLLGCASSMFSRTSSTRVDNTYDQADSVIRHSGEDSPLETYENSSEVAQGIMVGTAAGAVAGGLVTSGTAGILPGAGLGALFGGIAGAVVEQATNSKDRIENRGVKVFVLGDQVKIIIPSAQLFRDGTAKIYPNSYATLDAVAKLLSQYTTMSIKVAAFYSGSGSGPVNCANSQLQADAVVKYLWPRLNTRLLYGIGLGNTQLVEMEGGPQNYRVEITTEKLPV